MKYLTIQFPLKIISLKNHVNTVSIGHRDMFLKFPSAVLECFILVHADVLAAEW